MMVSTLALALALGLAGEKAILAMLKSRDYYYSYFIYFNNNLLLFLLNALVNTGLAWDH